MPMFLIQSAILIAIAFVIGCILGCLLRRWFGSDSASVPAAAVATAATAVAATSALAAKPQVNVAPEVPVSTPEPARQPEPAPVLAAALPVAEPEKPKLAPRPKLAAKPKVSAKPKAAAKPAPVVSAKPDDLKLIVGIGPVNERKLNALGVNRFAHIAGWSAKDEADYGHKLEFPGRIEREEWVRQAKALDAGGASEDKAELARKRGAAPAKSSAPKAASLVSDKATKAEKPKAEAKPAVKKPVASSRPKPEKKPMAAKLAAPVGGKPDNLTLINGIGNVIEKKLHGMGIFHFEQIANWTKAQAEDFSKSVGFPGRAEREGWMKEAALFAKGGTTEHARKVEAGAIPSSRKSTAAEKGATSKGPKKK